MKAYKYSVAAIIIGLVLSVFSACCGISWLFTCSLFIFFIGLASLLFTTSAGIMIFLCLGILCVFAIFIIFGPVMFIKGVSQTAFYVTQADNTEEIFATVTGIHENYSDDTGGYDIYVTYRYDDVEYKNILWDSVSRKDKYIVGDNVRVEIFKSKPNVVADFNLVNYIGWAFPLFITICGVFAVKKTFFPMIRFFKKKKQTK